MIRRRIAQADDDAITWRLRYTAQASITSNQPDC